MVLATPVLLLLLPWVSLQAVAEICRGTHCYGAETGDLRPCTGAHCPGSRSSRPPRQFNPTTQGRAAHIVASQHHVYPSSPRAASAAYPAVQPLRGRHGDGSGGTRVRALEVVPARCADVDCGALLKQFQHGNDTRDCRGIECRLPPRIRPKPRAKSCAGEGCVPASEESVSSAAAAAASQLPPVHLSDRAAQFLGDFPELGYPTPELGGAPLGVQLTCDIKPGLLPSSSSPPLSSKMLTVVFLLI